MEPQSVCAKASQLAESGDLQAAVDLLDPVLEEFREYGPAYLLHARVFMMAGDCAQAMIDIDAAEWANREYGTRDQLNDCTELRTVLHAIRSIYGGQTEAAKCRECVVELIANQGAPESFWFLPAACFELGYKAKEAEAWVEKLAKINGLKPAADFYFEKRSKLTRLLAAPKTDEDLTAVHFARHYRARREGDKRAAEKHLKRMTERIKPRSLWSIVYLYASKQVEVVAV
jgi:hypothetical protein